MTVPSDARDFLDAVAGYSDPDAGERTPSQDQPVRIATVDPAYMTGYPKVTFDGETTMGTRTYVPLVSVFASDRVVMIPVGNTYVIAGVLGMGSSVPVGASLDGYWTAAPYGFLLEDGSVQVRATYPRLFAVIGTTFNTGGETGSQFRLPDSRGRVQVAKSSDTEFDVLGEKFGAKTVQLTAAESGLPSHWHDVGLADANDGNLDVGAMQQVTGAFSGWRFEPSATSGTALRKWIAGNNAAAAAASAHNNIQPSIVVLRVIKF